MRKYKRLPLNLPAAVRTAAGQSGHRIHLLRTVDISAGGARFCAECGLPVGMEVSVVIFLRSNPRVAGSYLRIAFHGTVVRSESWCFAVAFSETGQAAGLGGISEPEMPASDIPFGVSKRPDKERS